jgi:UDP-glucose 4-epimerase
VALAWAQPLGSRRAMHALVTGGAGFIGSNLVDALLTRGHEVSVLDDLSTGKRENVDPAARLVVGSVVDPPALAECDVVFHLAAQIDVRRAVEDPAFDARVNVGGTTTMLEHARAAGARRFVLASTGGAIYGDASVIPTPESAPAAPISPYGASKAAAELYLDLYLRLHGLSTVALRFANVYGPRQDPRLEGGVVAIFTTVAAEGRRGTVFGDGHQTRDFVYVGDVVEALLAAGEAQVTGAYNVGTGQETSVLELAAAVGIEVEHAPERPGEVRRSCLDAARIDDALGWRARTSLADGLARTAATA